METTSCRKCDETLFFAEEMEAGICVICARVELDLKAEGKEKAK